MIEVKNTVTKLYSFISKMMILVEQDLEDPNIINGDDSCAAKKNMTSIFEKLISLVMQLNRLSKDEQMHLTDTLPEEDMKIIERFIERYKK
jgi:hypothetical protein